MMHFMSITHIKRLISSSHRLCAQMLCLSVMREAVAVDMVTPWIELNLWLCAAMDKSRFTVNI